MNTGLSLWVRGPARKEMGGCVECSYNCWILSVDETGTTVAIYFLPSLQVFELWD